MKTTFPFRFSAWVVFLAATSFSGIALLAQEAERLVPQFIPGKIYTYTSDTNVTMQLPTPDGGTAERKVDMSHDARFAVAARPAGPGAVLDASTQRLQFKVTAPDKEMRYDSADDTTKGSSLGRHFEGSRMRTVIIEVDETPKIVKSEEKGGGGPATPLPGMPQFGPDELKQIVSSLLQGFAPDPVKPGSQWTQKGKRSLGQFGEMDFEISYHYTGDETIDGAVCAIIGFTGEMKGDVAVAGAQPGSAGSKLGFEGKKLVGRLVFDKLRHAVRETSQTVDLTIDVPNPDPAATEKLHLPVKQSVTVKLTALQDS